MNANASHDHPDIDQTIDRALSALCDAHPRSGLNGRILASLEHRTAPEATNPGGLPFRAAKGWGTAREFALWAVTSAAILAVASLAILHHSVPSKSTVILSAARSAESKNPDTAHTTTIPEPFSTTNLAVANTPANRTHRMAHLATATMPAPCAHPGCPVHDDGAAVVMSGPTTDPDAQALADLHAPSHPAPPIPMTAQEKLFRRMAQFHNATQLAELDPIVRAKESADETTAFKAFFPDPPPLKQAGDTE